MALRHWRGVAFGGALLAAAAAASAEGDARRGQYIASAAGCAGCHTGSAAGDPPYAGGRMIETPFGKFYGPNITPHAEHGLGKWSQADLLRALRHGESPAGTHYYPAFPYPSFTGMTAADVGDLWAYLRSIPPVDRPNRPHDLRFPFGWRSLAAMWKWLFFKPRPFSADPKASAQLNRGAYLVRVLGHCGECHTARNFLGAPREDRRLAGGRLPEGRVPNLTPTRLKKWTDSQLKEYLRSGATPEGDAPADTMYEVIRDTTGRLTRQDLDALVAYLRSLPPLPEEPK